MKKVYFVRHGETDSNVQRTWQDPEEPLNERGQAQVAVLAARTKSLVVDKMLVSSMPRAIQTANAIVAQNRMNFEISDLFREIKPPTCLIGAEHSDDLDSLVQKFKAGRISHTKDEGWHFEDEENAADFLNRIKDSLTYLESLQEQAILVVTHGNYLRCCLGFVITGGTCTAGDMSLFSRTSKMTNAGITVMSYTDSSWVLDTWNDSAHFAE